MYGFLVPILLEEAVMLVAEVKGALYIGVKSKMSVPPRADCRQNV